MNLVVAKELGSFSCLPVGARFRLPTPTGYIGGVYFKTGPASYGSEPGQALWPWHGVAGDVVELVPAILLADRKEQS